MTSWLFPARNRFFNGKRWVKISLRTLHIWSVAVVVGAYIYGIPHDMWLWLHHLLIFSGFALVVLDGWTHGIYFLQLRCHIIFFKVLLLLAWHPWYPTPFWFLAGLLMVSSFIAHAPGDVRYYSPWHRKRIDEMRDIR
ncbi:hypothetical protein [Chrysiogenes arsenatis]|uniref:hypothetical protein n=1 Tax=Chrysiogenes arsenatis TaxID=309797 RepID=UPI00048290F0|nr:hypothetical protein [Chrysiogenes arsenatis]